MSNGGAPTLPSSSNTARARVVVGPVVDSPPAPDLGPGPEPGKAVS